MINAARHDFMPPSHTQMTHSTKLKQVAIGLLTHESEAPLRTPEELINHARAQIGDCDREHLLTYHMNNQGEITSFEVTSIGSLSACPVSPREVLKAAILSSAAYVIVVHNHPSGNCKPSKEDKAMEMKLRTACRIVDIHLLDFVIVSATKYYSSTEVASPDEAEADVQPVGGNGSGAPPYG